MNKTDLAYFEELFTSILDKGRVLEKQTIVEFKTEVPEKGDDVEQLTQERDNVLRLKLSGRKKFFLKKVETALDRIQKGTFGQCEECERKIEMNRLKARPTATQCLQCKEDMEKIESHILYHKRSHTAGKLIIGNLALN